MSTEPRHAAVRPDGAIESVIVCTVEAAQEFRDFGWVEMLWPGCELVDVTDVDPRPGIGWTRDGGTWQAPPPPEPEPPVGDEPAAESTSTL